VFLLSLSPRGSRASSSQTIRAGAGLRHNRAEIPAVRMKEHDA
jgi:hypothetical protein